MIKQTIISLFFLLACNIGKCQPDDENTWRTFEGTLGVDKVQLSLYKLGTGELKGNYCLKKQETKVQIDGKQYNDSVKLAETINGKVTGFFNGILDGNDSLIGTWIDKAKTKKIPFRLHLESTTYSRSFSHRYQNLPQSDSLVEKFMAQVKSAILKGDKHWLANNIHYPVSINLDGKRINIRNVEQFLSGSDGIFSKVFKENIEEACLCNLFYNHQGVMLGGGEVWINSFKTSSGIPRLLIIAINN